MQRLRRSSRTFTGLAGGNQSGAAALELALVLPVLVLLVFGIVQFGIVYNRVQGLHAAAREGARLASLGASFDDIQTRVDNAQSLFNAADVVVTTTPASSGSSSPCASAGVGNAVTVQVTVNPNPSYAITIPLFGSYRITYRSSGTFRCEQAG